MSKIFTKTDVLRPSDVEILRLSSFSALGGKDTATILRKALVLDENVRGLSSSSTDLAEIFPNWEVLQVENVATRGSSDSQIVAGLDVLKDKGLQVILVTKDMTDNGSSFYPLLGWRGVIRFSNGGVSTDTQISLLWCLTKTAPFRIPETLLGKDIRLGMESLLVRNGGDTRPPRKLHIPNPHSEDYRRWIPR